MFRRVLSATGRKGMELKQGTIATAMTLMPNGKSKVRPVVVVPPTHLIPTLPLIRVVGISCSYRPDDPDIIPLAWRPDGNIYTGLKRPSAISLALRDDVELSTLKPSDKWVGKAALIELLERLKGESNR